MPETTEKPRDVTCYRCQGSGVAWRIERPDWGPGANEPVRCRLCRGTGRVSNEPILPRAKEPTRHA